MSAPPATPTRTGRRRLPRRVRLALRLAATAAALAAVALVVGADAVRAGTAVLSPGPVVAALALGALWRALATARWLVVARALGAPLAPAGAYAEYTRSELVNQVVPGGVVGDLDRARRHGTTVGLLPAARGVVVERVLGQATLVAATAVAVASHPSLLGVADGVDGRTVTVLAAAAVVAPVVVLLLWQPWRTASGPRSRGTVGRWAAAVGLGAVASLGVLACFVATFVLAARATGSDAAVADLLPAVLVTLLVSGVPLTVAGWGAREAGAALAFASVGLGAAEGVATSVGYGLLALVAALPGLLPLALPHRSTRPEGRGEVEVEAHVVAQPERP
ncbi:lysylphosphatidylglycerol synthase transmembrane domain-containing protein [Aquipuribacter nitratireducens]|uniref:YbhN family protein n=1 Tax=Aquipuribacter nitratireducens TaxID=650104 RepID=A0ABW0GRQ7_9MICO